MSISAPRDDNRIPTKLATSNADGSTIISVCANPSTNTLCVMDGSTGSSFPTPATIQRDDNRVPVMWALSSADGVTKIPIYADSVTKKLLIKST